MHTRHISLFTSLSRTIIATIFSEAVLQTCQHQLPQVLTATTAHHIITSLQVGPLSHNFLCFSAITGPFLATSAPLPSHRNYGTFLLQLSTFARNYTSDTQCTTPKVPAPHQGCSTAHRGSEGTNDSSSTSSGHRS